MALKSIKKVLSKHKETFIMLGVTATAIAIGMFNGGGNIIPQTEVANTAMVLAGIASVISFTGLSRMIHTYNFEENKESKKVKTAGIVPS